jgi:hypothetical protein
MTACSLSSRPGSSAKSDEELPKGLWIPELLDCLLECLLVDLGSVNEKKFLGDPSLVSAPELSPNSSSEELLS